MKHDPQRTFAALSLLIADLVKTMDCNKTMDEDEIIFAVQTLIDDYPVMKLEEWKHVCDNIKRGKYGKLYERLKLPELVDAFGKHEEKRAEMMENMHRQKQKEQDKFPVWQDEVYRRLAKDLKLPEGRKPHGRWDFIPYPNTPLDDEQKTEQEQS
jgi:hypothetical protein